MRKLSLWLLGFEVLTIEQSDASDDVCEVETVESDSVASIDFGFGGDGE